MTCSRRNVRASEAVSVAFLEGVAGHVSVDDPVADSGFRGDCPNEPSDLCGEERGCMGAGTSPRRRIRGPLEPATRTSTRQNDRALMGKAHMWATRTIFALFIGALAFFTYQRPNDVVSNGVQSLPPTGQRVVEFLTTKTPYDEPVAGAYTGHVKPEECELVHVNYLARHGSRHSNKLDSTRFVIDEFRKAGGSRVSPPCPCITYGGVQTKLGR